MVPGDFGCEMLFGFAGFSFWGFGDFESAVQVGDWVVVELNFFLMLFGFYDNLVPVCLV